MHGIKDAALYRKMSEPFPSRKELGEALNGFFAEVRALREKYKLPDVTTIISANFLDGTVEGTIVTHGHNGDSAKQLMMLAQTYGAAKKEHDIVLEKISSETNFEEDV